MPALQVLVVEDDSSLRLAVTDNLEDEGYVVVAAASLAAARSAVTAQPFDVVVLDLMLPDGDGSALCRELRKAGNAARVLMLTARTLEDDLVKGFEAGADDYLAKPYRLRELLARVAALGRRAGSPLASTHALGHYQVDETKRTVTGPSGAVELTRKEFDLLVCLLRAGDAVVKRDDILDAVWGDVVVDTHTVDNFVSSLKKKLKADSSGFELKTVRGVGFRLVR
ncbi:MAG: response regulator transcription factor [Archangium sp.]|nr:response regulator transcription factor [Archangium sp.]